MTQPFVLSQESILYSS